LAKKKLRGGKEKKLIIWQGGVKIRKGNGGDYDFHRRGREGAKKKKKPFRDESISAGGGLFHKKGRSPRASSFSGSIEKKKKKKKKKNKKKKKKKRKKKKKKKKKKKTIKGRYQKLRLEGTHGQRGTSRLVFNPERGGDGAKRTQIIYY